jgi:thymidylate kinase
VVAELVDGLIGERALVFGSLPPEGRDLDLLVRPGEERAISEGLAGEAFVSKGIARARFADCSAAGVDLVPATDWALPEREVARLFDDAFPIVGFRNLVRPAPHHVLLIVARRVLHGDGVLDAKRRRYVETALGEDPSAWNVAMQHAPAWGASAALGLLKECYEGARGMSLKDRAEAIAEEMRARGAQGGRAIALGIRSAATKGGHKGAVVAISGLDGAGKSSQATALVTALEALGIDAATEWTRITRNRSLDVFAAPVKWVLKLFGRKEMPPEVSDEDEPYDAGREFRRKSPFVTQIWTVVVAVTNALTQRRVTRAHLKAGRVVVCDRYVLDSAVHLRWLYGADRKFSFQTALVRWLSPKPVRSFFLDIDPEVAYERKPDFDLDELTDQAALYRRLHPEFDARRIDGTADKNEICAEIAREVWLALD